MAVSLRSTIHLWDLTGNRRFQQYKELHCIHAHWHHKGMVWGHFSSLLLHDCPYFHFVLCSLLSYCEPRPLSQDVPVVGLTARCTGQGSSKYDLCMWSRALPTDLLLHGMSCNALISHPGFLGKSAASLQGVDCHSQHSMDWVVNDLHLVTLAFHHDPNPYSPTHRSARTWDLTINPCHFTF